MRNSNNKSKIFTKTLLKKVNPDIQNELGILKIKSKTILTRK